MKNLGFSYLNGTVLLRLGIMLATSLEMDSKLHLSKETNKPMIGNDCIGDIATNITHNTVVFMLANIIKILITVPRTKR